ncbi:Ribosomal RNA small subunit methyltransferase B [Candidatus Rubidus massiliensis]|nr:Ribosomal RNA small subunit methyltransferase B [Candidatus Rubidus massiliensis]
MDKKTVANPPAREIAFLAVKNFWESGVFSQHILKQWEKSANPSSADYRFAQELCYGTIQRDLTLQHIIKTLVQRHSLKLKEKVILKLSLYQYFFMPSVPNYAIANEMVSLAKKYCHFTFANFLNAILHKINDRKLTIAESNDLESLSSYYSYPVFLIQELLKNYGLDTTKYILEWANNPSLYMARIRNSNASMDGGYRLTHTEPMLVIEDNTKITQISMNSDFYIQNVTSVELLSELSNHMPLLPKKILDLCAAPGGKALWLYDKFFPQSEIYCYDASLTRLTKLKDNLKKYNASIQILNLEDLENSKHFFDLIVIDAPCSNSGVLNKRPEARWRITKEHLDQQILLQTELIKNAMEKLTENGAIWYITCSILKKENENLLQDIIKNSPLEITWQKTILPNREGWDGGFGALLTRSKRVVNSL